MKPEQRQAAIDKNMAERKASERCAWPSWFKKRDRYVGEQRKAAPAKPADSFDRAVADTLKAQIKR